MKNTPRKGLFFCKSEQRNVEVFTDVDWAGLVTNGRSTFEYCTFLWENLVTWRSKKQSMVAQSSVEVEFWVMTHGVCELLWLKRVLEELQQEAKHPIKLWCDNMTTISIAYNPIKHDRTKHVELIDTS